MAKPQPSKTKPTLPKVPDASFRINSRCKPLVKSYWEWVAAGRPMKPKDEQHTG